MRAYMQTVLANVNTTVDSALYTNASGNAVFRIDAIPNSSPHKLKR